MIDIENSSIIYMLPSHLKQKPEIQAIGAALNIQVKKVLSLCNRISLYSKIDELDGEVLDILAAELKTQFYNAEFSLEIKRDLIKNALKWYMKVGTPKAIEEMVTVVFGQGKIVEWYEYGGKPFRFKVITNATIDDTNIEKFNEMIRNVKNARSILEAVESIRNIETSYKYGSYTYGYYEAPDIE